MNTKQRYFKEMFLLLVLAPACCVGQRIVFEETFGSDQELYDGSWLWHSGQPELTVSEYELPPFPTIASDNSGVYGYNTGIHVYPDIRFDRAGILNVESTMAVRGGKLYMKQLVHLGPNEGTYFHGTSRVGVYCWVEIEAPIIGLDHDCRLSMDLGLISAGRGGACGSSGLSFGFSSPEIGGLGNGAWNSVLGGGLVSGGSGFPFQSFTSFDVRLCDVLGLSEVQFDERYKNAQRIRFAVESKAKLIQTWDNFEPQWACIEFTVDNIRIYDPGQELTIVAWTSGHFVSDEEGWYSAATSPIHVQVLDYLGNPVQGAAILLQDTPYGQSDINGRLDFSWPIPDSPPVEGPFASKVKAAWYNLSGESELLTVYNLEQLVQRTATLSAYEAFMANVTRWLAYMTPTVSSPPGRIGRIWELFGALLSFLKLYTEYSAQAGDVVTVETYECTAPDVAPAWLIRETIVRDGQLFLERNSWTESAAQYYDATSPIPEQLRRGGMLLTLASPAALYVTAPDGSHAGYDPLTRQLVFDFPIAISQRGDEPFLLFIPHPVNGYYLINVIQEPNALPDDTYSLEVTRDGQTIVLAKNVLVKDIPDDGYRITIGDTITVFGSVDQLVSIYVGRASYNRRTGQFSINVTVTNTSDTIISEPVWLIIEGISNPNVTLASGDGITSDGKEYIDLSGLLGDGYLDTGESITSQVHFNNPNRERFTFEVSTRGIIY